METLKKLSFLLTDKERFRAILLLVMTLIMALVDMLVSVSLFDYIKKVITR